MHTPTLASTYKVQQCVLLADLVAPQNDKKPLISNGYPSDWALA